MSNIETVETTGQALTVQTERVARSGYTVTSMTVGYTEKRSTNYQSFEASHSVSVEIEEDGDVDAIFAEIRSDVYRRAHGTVKIALSAYEQAAVGQKGLRQ